VRPVQVLSGVASITYGSNSEYRMCVVMAADGGLRCWGSNVLGCLGIGSVSITLQQPPETCVMTGVTQAVVGRAFTCTLITGEVRCFGANSRGQLGDGTQNTRYIPPESPVAIPDNIHKLAAGENHACAIPVTPNSELQCWGAGDSGQLDTGALSDSLLPTSTRLLNVVEISLGSFHSCAITSNQQLHCWGTNGYAALGLGASYSGSNAVVSTPTSVPGQLNTLHVACSKYFTCSVSLTGDLQCWGSGTSYGQLGIGNADISWLPSSVVLSNVEAVFAGSETSTGGGTCALMLDGCVKCWGTSTFWGDGTTGIQQQYSPPVDCVAFPGGTQSSTPSSSTTMTASPLPAPSQDYVLQFDVGPYSALATTAKGDVYSWEKTMTTYLEREWRI
jgi:alpha-tubulin suppressor-like RCC1 family protein